jgi:2,3-bisphosphoglycerate-dependent phosphoglycerate mutase
MRNDSQLGERQANALGRWFALLSTGERPNVVLSSPYLRAQSTARAVQSNGGLAPDFGHLVIDERLRESLAVKGSLLDAYSHIDRSRE